MPRQPPYNLSSTPSTKLHDWEEQKAALTFYRSNTLSAISQTKKTIAIHSLNSFICEIIAIIWTKMYLAQRHLYSGVDVSRSNVEEIGPGPLLAILVPQRRLNGVLVDHTYRGVSTSIKAHNFVKNGWPKINVRLRFML